MVNARAWCMVSARGTTTKKLDRHATDRRTARDEASRRVLFELAAASGGAAAGGAAADGASRSPDDQATLDTARDTVRQLAVAHDSDTRHGQRDLVLWPVLLSGRWRVLDSFMADRGRYLIAYAVPPAATPTRTLMTRERAVIEYTLDERSGKWIAFELEISESTVTRALHTAAHALGAPSVAALAGVRTARFTSLAITNPAIELAFTRLAPARSLAGLSTAEQAIVFAVLDGKRIAAIAHERGTSSRTVGHQLASVYKKLEVSSRRELLARITDSVQEQPIDQ
jgi:DNA-binding NarL/FixJ family response regulator